MRHFDAPMRDVHVRAVLNKAVRRYPPDKFGELLDALVRFALNRRKP